MYYVIYVCYNIIRTLTCLIINRFSNLLGKLTKDQIKAGFLALKKIDNLIQKGQSSGTSLIQACNEFYTRIPHDFG